MNEDEPARPEVALHPFSRFRPSRAAILLALALATGLLADWLRRDRVVFPRPLPTITTEAAP